MRIDLKIKETYKLHFNRFLKFSVVGGIGAGITFGLTWLFTEQFGFHYMVSMVIAVGVATVSNFTLNTVWTFALGRNMNDAEYEWNAYYKGNIIQRWWKRSIIQKVESMIPRENRESLSILDIGCGSSPIAKEIGSKNYIGIDYNEQKIKFMQNKLPEYQYHTVPNYQNGHKSDVVMSIEVIEHLPDMLAANNFVKNISDSVRVGGKVIIATPDYNTRTWRMVEKVYDILMPSAYAGDHKVKFNEQSLKTMCSANNLIHEKTTKVLGCDMVCCFKKIV
jgi:2-polyprenyl-3-methyl-5-hydroxy-6-metoxy-1,4-benzoquinol methylase